MRATKMLAGILITGVITASACADVANITAPQRLGSQSPRFDGTGWVGSGNRTDNGGMVGLGNIVDRVPRIDETKTTAAPPSAEAGMNDTCTTTPGTLTCAAPGGGLLGGGH